MYYTLQWIKLIKLQLYFQNTSINFKRSTAIETIETIAWQINIIGGHIVAVISCDFLFIVD
jgi:hypothetical protein